MNPFSGCNFKFVDSGAFRCNKAYVKLFSMNNQQLTIIEKESSTGFDFEKFIPYDFCSGGIEVGYDISLGKDFPIRERFTHGGQFRDKIIDLNSLLIQISGTIFSPKIFIRDGISQKIRYEA